MSAQTIINYRRRISGEAYIRFSAPEELPDGRRINHVFSEAIILADDLPELLFQFRDRPGYVVEPDAGW
jgi:hypothetical protein